MSLFDYGVIAVYLSVSIAIGLHFSGRNESSDDFLLGGRQIAWAALGVSYFMTLLSTISLVGMPGEAYRNGLTNMLWPLLGVFFSIGFFFLFVRFFFLARTYTPFQYLERRFGAAARATSAGIYCLARLFYLAVVLFASARVFEGVADWPAVWTILLIGAIGTIYTTLGGLRAVVWTDFLQFVVLTGGIGIVLWVMSTSVPGGLGGLYRFAGDNNHLFPQFDSPEFFSFDPYVRLTLWAIVLRSMADHMFYKSADQIVVQRLLAASGYRAAFKVVVLGSLLAPIVVVVLYTLGLGTFEHYSGLPASERPPADIALFRYITEQLPSPVPGLIVAAMLAAIMSTIDSGINSLSTVLTKDFYTRFVRPDASEREQVRFVRRTTLLLGAFATLSAVGVAALSEQIGSSVLEVTGILLAFMVILAPPFLIGVLSRRATQRDVVAAVVVGMLAVCALIGWYYAARAAGHEPGFHNVAVGGFLATALSAFVLSRFRPVRSETALRNLTLRTLGDSADAR